MLSLRETVLAMGGKYVAVDVAEQRPVKVADPRRGAVVLRQGDKYLSILSIKGDGRHAAMKYTQGDRRSS